MAWALHLCGRSMDRSSEDEKHQDEGGEQEVISVVGPNASIRTKALTPAPENVAEDVFSSMERFLVKRARHHRVRAVHGPRGSFHHL